MNYELFIKGEFSNTIKNNLCRETITMCKSILKNILCSGLLIMKIFVKNNAYQ